MSHPSDQSSGQTLAANPRLQTRGLPGERKFYIIYFTAGVFRKAFTTFRPWESLGVFP